jgi:hypothetical protein
MLFFSSYEYSKKALVNAGMQDFMAYLAAGLVGDLFASSIYVPSEVCPFCFILMSGCQSEITITGFIQQYSIFLGI